MNKKYITKMNLGQVTACNTVNLLIFLLNRTIR